VREVIREIENRIALLREDAPPAAALKVANEVILLAKIVSGADVVLSKTQQKTVNSSLDVVSRLHRRFATRPAASGPN
jgi:hypothetical protein